MTSFEFVRQMEEILETTLAGLDNLELVESESKCNVEIIPLLKIALKNEIEASQLAALWIISTPEIDVKLGYARQSGDEAKHYRMIEKRLNEMGVDSLMVLELGLGIKDRIGVTFSAMEFLRGPNLQQLADMAESRLWESQQDQ